MVVHPEISSEKRFGYARVSSDDQTGNSSLASQIKELEEQNIPPNNIFVETYSASGDVNERPVFRELIKNLKPWDLLIVVKLDRCSRNTLSFLNMNQLLASRNIIFVALDLPFSTDTASQRLIHTVLISIAQFENERRRERQRCGIEAAKLANKYKGRKTVITQKLVSEIKDLKEKEISVSNIAKIKKISRSTVYKILKEELHYVSNKLVKSSKSEFASETSLKKARSRRKRIKIINRLKSESDY